MTAKFDNRDDAEQVEMVKTMVSITFEALDQVEKEIAKLQKRKMSLKRDISDMKDGRLDRIQERHGLDKKCKDTSMFTVQEKVLVGGGEETNQWYIPFLVKFYGKEEFEKVMINNSVAKKNAPGAYKLYSGEVKHL